MKKIAMAGALALFATSASAVTNLTVADSGKTFDIFADDYQFQATFDTGEMGPLDFTFENTSASDATIVLSAGSIGQTPTALFSGGASIDWENAGNVTNAGQGVSSGGNLSFILAAGTSDTLTLTFGAVSKTGTNSPDIDFFVSAVPLPAGALLMGTALAGFGVAARRKRKAS